METTSYLIKREAGRYLFVPSPLFTGLMTGGFGAGSVFLLYLSMLFLRHEVFWLGAVFLLTAAFSAGLGIRAWRTRRTPLIIDNNGRVSYGERRLCDARTVRAVRIAPARGGEAGDCEVCLECQTGNPVSIPSQYFAGFKSSEQARPFAREVAKALGVPVVE
jgi:hypothetical protein